MIYKTWLRFFSNDSKNCGRRRCCCRKVKLTEFCGAMNERNRWRRDDQLRVVSGHVMHYFYISIHSNTMEKSKVMPFMFASMILSSTSVSISWGIWKRKHDGKIINQNKHLKPFVPPYDKVLGLSTDKILPYDGAFQERRWYEILSLRWGSENNDTFAFSVWFKVFVPCLIRTVQHHSSILNSSHIIRNYDLFYCFYYLLTRRIASPCLHTSIPLL